MIKRLIKFIKYKAGRVIERVDNGLCKMAGNWRVSAKIYYCFFSRDFDRELFAVIRGRGEFLRLKKSGSVNNPCLRRNIHRLEKAMIMRPRRLPFALAYIEETVDAFENAVKMKHSDKIEQKWASDVLNEYFRLHSNYRELECVCVKFRRAGCTVPELEDCEKLIPFRYSSTQLVESEKDSIFRIIRNRRSVRWFKNKLVDRELVDRALLYGSMAPSACNRQPYYFRVFDDKDRVQEILKMPGGASGFADNVPGVIVVIGTLNNYPYPRDRHLIYIDGALASMAVILSLEAQGVSTCCINWPDIEDKEKRMSKILNLKVDERPIMIIAFGYGEDGCLVPRSCKKSLENIRSYNK